ncbi:MAG: stilbene synthase [Opitutales bacterium]
MYLQSIASAVPPHRFTQAECWEIIDRSKAKTALRDRSLALLKKVLTSDNGIDYRHFAAPCIEKIFDLDGEQLNRTFEAEAPALAGRALAGALDRAGIKANDLNALIICTCTGYLCPGLSSYVAEKAGLRPDAFLQDFVGLGCGAAIPSLRSASHFTTASPGCRIAVIAVEVCSAAFYLDNDPGVLISACLFGDGASASIWSSTPGPSGLQAHSFSTLHRPEDRERLRMENRAGKLRNKLCKSVPGIAAAAVRDMFPPSGAKPVAQIIAHPGGRDVLTAIEREIPAYRLGESSAILKRHGNMSSPSVLFALEERLKYHPVHDDLWLVSFGAGFSCHACRVGRVKGEG